jgi:Tol biopolymer transport system component
VQDVTTRAGVADVFVQTIDPRGGHFVISRVLKDGRLQAVWDKTNSSVSAIAPAGDSVAAVVERADGKQVVMILPVAGGTGRTILKPNDVVSAWSNDGKWMVYQADAGGETDLGLLNVADGTTRRLTTTPESEYEATFTPDGKTIVFRRRTRLQTIWTTDLTKLLAGGK